MKIGILTLPLHTNYGGILQAYALQTVLERMGHEVVLFTKKPKIPMLPLWKSPFVYGWRLCSRLFLNPHKVIFYEQTFRKEQPVINQYVKTFKDRYIHQRFLDSLHEVGSNEVDAIVVGSDQIWRPKYFRRMWGKCLEDAFLGFAEDWNVKRLAYAASFGVDSWEFPLKHSQKYIILARHFDKITVREESGVMLCRKNLMVESECVLDPTMLLERKDYDALIDAANVSQNDGNLLCYILDNTAAKQGLIERVSRERKLKPFSVKAKNMNECASLQERILPSVEFWLRGFRDARFIITDSFHACVFSIIYGKPFVAIGNASRGLSRLNSLLGQFGLERNLLLNVSEYDPSYDYGIPAKVYSNLLEKVCKSMEVFSVLK